MDEGISAAESDAFWLGAFTMIAARAIFWARNGNLYRAARELEIVLDRYAKSNYADHDLLEMIAPWWEPDTEGGE